jgi:3-dehydro-L-gulonate 2-dehydrogenase
MFRVPFADLQNTLERTLLPLGFSPARAERCARLFAETTCDGVYTHGLARFPRLLATLRNGSVNPAAEPVRVAGVGATGSGAMERWDGRHGVGNLNAWAAMDRAMELARKHGIGLVALAQTNHWMRGGTYGWQAAEAGFFGICFTNTLPNLPAWGAASPNLGNNPLVIAVPRTAGHVVLDMAMSQYSFGTLSAYSSRGQQLPFAGGFDAAGQLTTDPAAIEASGRALPIGLWKGSGLSMLLDMMAAMLSGGLAVHQIEPDPERETGLSQCFFAIHAAALGDLDAIADGIVRSLAVEPLVPGKPVRYPGEETLRVRHENLQLGVPVDPQLWSELTRGSLR